MINIICKAMTLILDRMIVRALPPGTRRERKDGLYEKQPSGKWLKVKDKPGKKEKKKVEGKQQIKNFENKWESKGVKTDIYFNEKRNQIELSTVIVPKESRGEGLGSKFMDELSAIADTNNSIITLTPSTDYGATSKKRLIEFYKKFGFVENKGKYRNLEISDDMYRLPK